MFLKFAKSIKHILNFQGRMSRKEFWTLTPAVLIAIYSLDKVLNFVMENSGKKIVFLILVSLLYVGQLGLGLILIRSIKRRLKDTKNSLVWLLIPVISVFSLLIISMKNLIGKGIFWNWLVTFFLIVGYVSSAFLLFLLFKKSHR